ncbi:MAG: alpha/beta hydrolase [Thermomicrobiales bacterium]|nr:alpha/beta hydrolase [Thermomicrobiales bacterium]
MSVTWGEPAVALSDIVHIGQQMLPLGTGVTVQYVAQGDPGGIPLVFVHGLSDSWRSFAPVLDLLPAQQPALSLSQRGHGESTWPRSGYGAHDFAADLVAFCNALRIPRAILVGHSLGSWVVQRFAIDYPERVAGIVLVGANASWQGNPVVTDIWDSVVAHLSDPVDPAFVRTFQHSERVPADRLEMMIAESLPVPARVWQQVGRAMLATDIAAELTRITAPALVIWGAEDPICGAQEQARLCQLLPQAELLAYPDAGHNLHWEHPERFTADVCEFVQRVRH